MERECKKCLETKPLELFRKRQGCNYGRSHECKKCHSAKYATGLPNTGRFQKGHKSEHGFKKGHTMSPFKGGVPQEYKDKIDFGKGARGRKHPQEEIEKRRQSLISLWETKSREHGRRGISSRRWSEAIIERDGGKCTECGSDEKLHAHHIIPWSNDKSKRFDINNGQTLCSSCHSRHHRLEESEKRKIHKENNG